MTITYLSEGASGGPATQAEAKAWADMSNQGGIIATGDHADLWYAFSDTGSIALPSTVFIGPDAKIAKKGHPENWEIEIVLGSLPSNN